MRVKNIRRRTKDSSRINEIVHINQVIKMKGMWNQGEVKNNAKPVMTVSVLGIMEPAIQSRRMVPPIVNTHRKNILTIFPSNQTGFCVLTWDLKTSNPATSSSFSFWLLSDSVIFTAWLGELASHNSRLYQPSKSWGMLGNRPPLILSDLSWLNW